MKQKGHSNAEGQVRHTVSASKRVYIDLRQRIVDMVLLPGNRIIEHDIAAEHGTSRTPVHEAVQRLAEEGLIEVRPRVGTFVSRIPLDGLEEAMLVRSALEEAIIAKAAERATPGGVAEIRDILERQAAFVAAKDQKGFHATDEAFHAAIAEVAEHPGVWPIILQAKTQVDRYRRLTLQIPGRMEQILAEHVQILEAIESGDAEKAKEALNVHLSLLMPGVEDTQIKHPDYFTGHISEHGTRQFRNISG